MEISTSFFQIRIENTKRCGIIVVKEQAEHNMACMVCGTQLVYDKTAQEQECIYCGSTESSAIYCPDGHFVCDSCHSNDAIAFLELLAEVDTSTDPNDVVDKALTHPSFKFHGPEHHSLVPAAILIAMKNRSIPKTDGTQVTAEVVLEGIRRGSKIPGGFCGYAGTCGALAVELLLPCILDPPLELELKERLPMLQQLMQCISQWMMVSDDAVSVQHTMD